MSGTKHVPGSFIYLGFYCLLRCCSTVPVHGSPVGKVKPKLSTVSLCWLQFVRLLGALPAALPAQDPSGLGCSWSHWGSSMEWCWHLEERCSGLSLNQVLTSTQWLRATAGFVFFKCPQNAPA